MITTNKVGVGTLFVSLSSNRVLLNLRSETKSYPLSWSLWGGMMHETETPIEALMREIGEEAGDMPEIIKTYAFDFYESNDRHFKYYSFVSIVPEEFQPTLNEESAGYAWVDLGKWPPNMHRGASASFCSKRSVKKIQALVNQHLNDLG